MKNVLMMIITSVSFGIITMITNAADKIQNYTNIQISHALKGEVIAVDKLTMKIELKNEVIRELNWPAMTMFFSVIDKSLFNDFISVKINRFEIYVTRSRKVLVRFLSFWYDTRWGFKLILNKGSAC